MSSVADDERTQYRTLIDSLVLLAGLSSSGREVLARMLADAFRSGVHETLVILHAAAVPPFQDGYEGSPYRDFAGRMEGWSWPAR
jgi:hypothetical protein